MLYISILLNNSSYSNKTILCYSMKRADFYSGLAIVVGLVLWFSYVIFSTNKQISNELEDKVKVLEYKVDYLQKKQLEKDTVIINFNLKTK